MQLELLVVLVLLRLKSARSFPKTDHSRMLNVTMKSGHTFWNGSTEKTRVVNK